MPKRKRKGSLKLRSPINNNDRNAKLKRICGYCGEAFYVLPCRARNGRDKHCSRKCDYAHRVTLVKLSCKYCGGEFYGRPAVLRQGYAKYCSRECVLADHCPIECRCALCGQTFYAYSGRVKKGGGIFCSIKCQKRAKSSGLENRFAQCLDSNCLAYIRQFVVGRYQADFYLPPFNTIVEVDGDYWHNIPRVKTIDRRREKHLNELGYRVIRVRERDINAGKASFALPLI